MNRYELKRRAWLAWTAARRWLRTGPVLFVLTVLVLIVALYFATTARAEDEWQDRVYLCVLVRGGYYAIVRTPIGQCPGWWVV